MPRPCKPDFLIEYEKITKAGPPRCCHTCDHYDGGGMCMAYNLRPPEEFVMLRDSCPMWECVLPF